MHDGGDVFGILAVLRADFVGVGLKGNVDAHGAHGLAVEASQGIRQFGIVGGAEALVRLIDVSAERIIFAVGGEHHRHAQALGLGGSLQVIQRVGNGDGRAIQVKQLAGEGVFLHHVARVVQLGVDTEQQANLFLRGHLADQIGDALVGILAPVLVHVQLAVIVEILEFQAVHIQDGSYAFHIGKLYLAGGFVGFNYGKRAAGLQKGLLGGSGLLIHLVGADVHHLVRADGRFGGLLRKGAAGAAKQHDYGQEQRDFFHV